jgi:diguanylate cyclase (GGDEF)-like protein/PAS domain S-box-containing protein
LGLQDEAESDIERFKKNLGPFVVAAEKTRMPMAFTNAKSSGNPIIFVNASFCKLMGYDAGELRGRSIESFLADNSPSHTGRPSRRRHKLRNGVDSEFQKKSGVRFWASVLISPVPDKTGKTVQHFVSLIDLTKHKRAEKALRAGEERFRMASNAAGLGIADIDLVSGKVHWSVELREMLGIAKDARVTRQTYANLVHPDDRAIAATMRADALNGSEGSDQEAYRIVRANDGDERWIINRRHIVRDDDGEAVRIVLTSRDVTLEKASQAAAVWAAGHDAVTRLPNRTTFRGRLDETMSDAAVVGGRVSLLLVDLDHFKHINDMLGHQAGDEALAGFARRLSEGLPQDACLARLGGDEFAVILPGIDSAEAEGVGRALLASLRAPIDLTGRTIDLYASIGVSTFPLHGRKYSALVHSADLALYAAKVAGGSTVRTFTPALRLRRQRELSMLRHARVALDRGWIEPFYQPKISLKNGSVAGYEALLRWRHPRAGLQLPASIATAFDDSRLSCNLGVAMAQGVLSDIQRWARLGLSVGTVAINASPAELRDPAYAGRLLDALADHGVPPNRLELEITETALIEDRGNAVVSGLRRLRAAGMTVALDDFGTGFSSLSHLRSFPVDVIKIDRSFVAGLTENATDRAIVSAILQLAVALDLTTVAEGVETQEQADFLRSHGCDLGQGFLFARALEASDVETRLTAHQVVHAWPQSGQAAQEHSGRSGG